MQKSYHLCINGKCASEYSNGQVNCNSNSIEELELEKLAVRSLFPNTKLTQFVVYGRKCVGLAVYKTV